MSLYQAALAMAFWFTAGVCAGIWFTMRKIEVEIRKADICKDDKRFIRGVLGIQNGERQ